MASPSAFGKRKTTGSAGGASAASAPGMGKERRRQRPRSGETAAGVGEARHLRAGKHEVGGISLQSPVQSPALSAGAAGANSQVKRISSSRRV